MIGPGKLMVSILYHAGEVIHGAALQISDGRDAL